MLLIYIHTLYDMMGIHKKLKFTQNQTKMKMSNFKEKPNKIIIFFAAKGA